MTVPAFLLRYLRRYTVWLALAVACAGGYALITGMMVVLFEPLFEEVLQVQPEDLPPEHQSVERMLEGGARSESLANLQAAFLSVYRGIKQFFGVGPRGVVFFLPALIISLFVIRAVVSFFSGYAFQRTALGVTNDVRNDLYNSVLEQSSRFHADHPSGEIISRIVNDITMMQTAVSTRIKDLVQQVLNLAVLITLLFSNDSRLALICLVLLPLVVVPIIRFGQGMRRKSHKSQERMAELANLVAEGVRGHRVVKAFAMEGFEYERFRQATRRHLRVNLRASVLDNLSSPVIETVGVAGVCALLMYAGLQIRNGSISGPAFMTFLFTLLFMYEPIRKLNKVNLVLQQSFAALRRVHALMQVPNEIAERDDARTIDDLEERILFDRVSFAYSDQAVLQDLTLEVKRGETVALVGPSGAGKSTIVNLLPRFFDTDEGRILIDDIDVRDMQLTSLRGLIGMVTQDTVLFNDTVRGNIAYGRDDIPMEQVRAAAKAAYADEFIDRLTDGYETVIGEGGSRLSGGQRQRLAIARAILKDAPILILDEATSQLDTESEALVQKALQNLMRGRTTLVIAHRLSTVLNSDRIVVLEQGRIVEEGTHEELLAHGGLYKYLYDLQFET